MKKVVIVAVLLLLVLGTSTVHASEPKGDEKIEETKKRIEEERERAREEEEEEEDEEDYDEEDIWDEDEEKGILGQLFAAIFDDLFDALFAEYLFTLRFANYPYEYKTGYRFNTTIYSDTEILRVVVLNLSNDFTVHFDETYGNAARLTFNASACHANLSYHIIFAESESLSLFSLNGGLTFHFPNVLVNGYIGGSLLDTLNKLLFSFGVSIQVYLPAGFYLDIYNLNAKYHSLWFSHLSGGVNYTLNRLTLGLGYTFSSYAGFNYHGPSFKVGVWF